MASSFIFFTEPSRSFQYGQHITEEKRETHLGPGSKADSQVTMALTTADAKGF